MTNLAAAADHRRDEPRTGVLLLRCPDAPGIVAAVAGFIAERGGNIVDAQQHTDRSSNQFFQRLVIELDDLDVAPEDLPSAFAPVAVALDMTGEFHRTDRPVRVAILASRQEHCLIDLLHRYRAGELPMDPVLVASNHPEAGELTSWFDVPFHHVPIGDEGRNAQEARLEELLVEADTELVVLARYMQVLSPGFCDRWAGRCINIHHSFLPAFAGSDPYRQAHARGVKVIGATAHYVTAELDAGPIIAQDVGRVTHRDTVEDFVRRGRELEVTVLASAVAAHLEHRIIVAGDRTIVFS